MSDDEDKSYEDSLKEIANEANWSQKPDWFIEAIADLNLQAGIGYSLTFHTNGSLVSGELISGETYFHEVDLTVTPKVGRLLIFENLINPPVTPIMSNCLTYNQFISFALKSYMEYVRSNILMNLILMIMLSK